MGHVDRLLLKARRGFVGGNLRAGAGKSKIPHRTEVWAGARREHSLPQSLLVGKIDWYAAYSGETMDADGRLAALEPVAANHERRLAVLIDMAEVRGFSTLSDLRTQAEGLTLATTQEFLDFPSGFPLLTEKYGAFAFKKKTLAVSEDALHMPFHMKQVDAIPLRADDRNLADPNHVRLADDLRGILARAPNTARAEGIHSGEREGARTVAEDCRVARPERGRRAEQQGGRAGFAVSQHGAGVPESARVFQIMQEE